MKVKILDTLNGSFVSIEDLIQSIQQEFPNQESLVSIHQVVQSLHNLKPIPKQKTLWGLFLAHVKRCLSV